MNKKDILQFLNAKGDSTFGVFLKEESIADEYAFEIGDSKNEFELLEESVLINEYRGENSRDLQHLIPYDQIRKLSTNY